MTAAPLFIGCAAGFSGDRTDAAPPVVRTLSRLEGRRVLMFETLAERTLALAQLARRADPAGGFEPLLDDMLRPVLAQCLANNIAIVGNFGAANPAGAAKRILAMAHELGVAAPRVAVVKGDDLSGEEHRPLLRKALGAQIGDIVSANAYLGAQPIAGALREGAQVVVCGRVADPSLAVGPILAHYGWAEDDWDRLGRATMAGHLLECGAQVTGGYFADPGLKDVERLHEVGFPIVQVDAQGDCIVSKAADTGGVVDERTVKEQLLYEIHDPAAYLTPDVVADITEAEVHAIGADRVALRGVRGHARPDTLKVTVCREGGWQGEGEISYAGPGAEARARLAGDVLRRRLEGLELRVDLIGALSLFADDAGELLERTPQRDIRDVRVRVAARHAERDEARRVAREVLALYTCGPAGGGGVRTHVTPRLETRSCFVPREAVRVSWEMVQ